MVSRFDYAPVECVNIPKMLFQDKQYENLSVDAKVLYSLLLDRKTMAVMNGWVDAYGTTYVIYPKSEMKKHLNASRYRVDMALEELEQCEQMVVVTQPNPGKPCQIYVKDITGKIEENMEEEEMCMMMKNSNDENKEQMMKQLEEMPEMHGMAVFVNSKDFIKLLDTLVGSESDEEDEELEEDAVLGDACDMGEELGLNIGQLAEEGCYDLELFFSYLLELFKKHKLNQLRAVLKALMFLFGGSKEYVEDMDNYSGYSKNIYLGGVVSACLDTTMDMLKNSKQE